MPALSEDNLLRIACIHAEQDLGGFIEAYSRIPNDPAAKRAASHLRQIKRYRLKRWDNGKMEAEFERAESVPIEEILKRSNSDGSK